MLRNRARNHFAGFTAILYLSACGGETEDSLSAEAMQVKSLIDAGDSRTNVPPAMASQALELFMNSQKPDKSMALTHLGHDGGGTHRFRIEGQSEADVSDVTVTGLRLVDKDAIYFDTVEIGNGQILSEALRQGRIKFMSPPFETSLGLRGLSGASETSRAFDGIFGLEPIDTVRSGAGGYVEDLVVDNPILAKIDCRFCGFATDPENGQISFALDAFSISGDWIQLGYAQNEVRIGQLAISDLRFPKSEYTGSEPGAVETAKTIDRINPFHPYYGELKGRDIYYGSRDVSLTIPSVTITEDTWEVDGFTRSVSLSDMMVDFRDSSEANVDLKMLELKLDPLNLSYHREGRFDRAGDVWTEEIEVRSENGFEIRMDMDLVGVNRALNGMVQILGNEDPSDYDALVASRNGLNDLAINSLTLEVTDSGLRERVISFLADREGFSVAAKQDELSQMGGAPILFADTKYQGELVMAFADSFSDFIKDGGTLRITVRPQNGSYKLRPIMEEISTTLWQAVGGHSVTPVNYDEMFKSLNIEFAHLPE